MPTLLRMQIWERHGATITVKKKKKGTRSCPKDFVASREENKLLVWRKVCDKLSHLTLKVRALRVALDLISFF